VTQTVTETVSETVTQTVTETDEEALAAATAAAAAAAAAKDDAEQQAKWGWIAFGLLALGVAAFALVLWLRSRRQAADGPGEPGP
jgi:hypothetical protein